MLWKESLLNGNTFARRFCLIDLFAWIPPKHARQIRSIIYHHVWINHVISDHCMLHRKHIHLLKCELWHLTWHIGALLDHTHNRSSCIKSHNSTRLTKTYIDTYFVNVSYLLIFLNIRCTCVRVSVTVYALSSLFLLQYLSIFSSECHKFNFHFSDPAMKQFLLHLDETNRLGKKFIIQDLDDTHLFIAAEVLDTLQNRIDELMDKHHFSVAQ